MKGVGYLVDEAGAKQAVVIDMKTHRGLWEDFQDLLLIHERRTEPRVSVAEVRQGLALQ